MASRAIILCISVVFIHMTICESNSGEGQKFMNIWLEEIEKLQNNPESVNHVKLTAKQQAWWDSLSSKHKLYKQQNGKFHANANNPIDYIDAPLHTRKEYREMTREEQTNFHDAVVATMNTFPDNSDGLSEFGVFVRQHQIPNAPGAHFGPAFFPWHREFLFRFERTLQAHDPTVSLPYWDSRLDRLLPEPHDSVMWTAEHFGNGDGNVTVGPYAYAPSIPECSQFGANLTRLLQSRENLYTHEEVHWINSQGFYANFTCRVGDPSCRIELAHGIVHAYFGITGQIGHLSQIPCAPTDPMFYLHHGFIDWMWEDFRQNFQITNPTREYPTSQHYDSIPFNQNWDDPMLPFDDVINAHGMGSHYTSYYYQYTESPSTINCNAVQECGGGLFWCNRITSQCVPKIKQGGQCEGLPDVACDSNCAMDESSACNRESGKCFCRRNRNT